MAAKRKTSKRKSAKRSGVVKVFNTAEISTNFPKSRKLVKQYRLTVYGDGRIVKSEIKTTSRRKRKIARKGKQKGAQYERDSQCYDGVVPIVAVAFALGLIGGGGALAVTAYQVRKTTEAADNVFDAATKTVGETKETAKIVFGGCAVLYGMHLLAKYAKQLRPDLFSGFFYGYIHKID